MVGPLRLQALSRGREVVAPGRQRWQQRLPAASVEAAAARVGRLVWPGGHGLPLPAWGEQVEPSGTPLVQPDQPQLGRGAATNAGVAAGVAAWDSNRGRLGS